MPNSAERIAMIKQAAASLLEAVDGMESVYLEAYRSGSVSVVVYNPPSYEESVALMRRLGIGVRNKEPYVDGGHTTIRGEAGGIEVRLLPNGLPPTCRKVTYMEKIPKTKTVDTGEFIEVERTKVVCDGGSGG